MAEAEGLSYLDVTFWCRRAVIFSRSTSFIAKEMPPVPKPDCLTPAKGIKSEQNAEWSLTTTARAARCLAARRAESMSTGKDRSLECKWAAIVSRG
jgi:hypothetical protein